MGLAGEPPVAEAEASDTPVVSGASRSQKDVGDTGKADAKYDLWNQLDATPVADGSMAEATSLAGEVGVVYDVGSSENGDVPLDDADVLDADRSPDAIVCAPEWWCIEGACVPVPAGCQKLSCASTAASTYCGLIGDGCGGVLDCGPTCPHAGWVCDADQRCRTPLGLCSDLACKTNSVQYCGPISDECGTIECPTSCEQPDWECVEGRCVNPACLPPACEWPPPPVSPPFKGESPSPPPVPAPCLPPSR